MASLFIYSCCDPSNGEMELSQGSCGENRNTWQILTPRFRLPIRKWTPLHGTVLFAFQNWITGYWDLCSRPLFGRRGFLSFLFGLLINLDLIFYWWKCYKKVHDNAFHELGERCLDVFVKVLCKYRCTDQHDNTNNNGSPTTRATSGWVCKIL